MTKIGIMVFGNEFDQRQISDWKLDEKIRATVAKTLSGRFEVKQMPIPAELGEAVDKLRGGLLADGRAENAPTLSKLTGGKNCKYILVVAAAGSKFGSTNQFVGGLGIVEAESVFGDARYIHAVAQARVFDGQSYAFLDWKNLRTGQNIFADVIQGPHQKIEMQAHPSLQAVADDPKTQEIILGLLDQSLKQTLPLLMSIDKPDTVARNNSVNQVKEKKDDWAPF